MGLSSRQRRSTRRSSGAIKKALCRETTGDRTWLHKVRPWWGHDYHFHVRLFCPADSAECEQQDPPPPGDVRLGSGNRALSSGKCDGGAAIRIYNQRPTGNATKKLSTDLLFLGESALGWRWRVAPGLRRGDGRLDAVRSVAPKPKGFV
jgi:Penicillin-insensitive murein endopeptidase